MTLKQLATAVRNNVVSGLKGIDFTGFSTEQLEDEILINTPALMLEYAANGLLNLDRVSQRIDGIEISCKDLSANCNVPVDDCAPHFEIPALNIAAMTPLSYLGTANGDFTFKVYLDRQYRFHKYRMATSKMPFAWVSTTSNQNGMFDVYLFNLGRYENLKFVSVEALFDDPYSLLGTEYYTQFSNAEFYAPAIVQGALVSKLSMEYIKYYRQMEARPKTNTQE